MQIMTQNGQISIQQVLAEIREHSGRTFFIQFVRITGKTRGTVKTVGKAVYGRSKTAGEMPSIKLEAQRKRALHIEKGTLPISDYDNGEYLTPLIACILSFNGYKVIH